MNPVTAYIAFAALAVGLGTAIPGWLVSIPDSANRYGCRFFAFGALFIAGSIFWVDDWRHGRWLLFAGALFGALWAWNRAGYWWTKWEQARSLDRAFRGVRG